MKYILPEWIKKLNYGELRDFNDRAAGASLNSQMISKGQIFFAFEGEKTDGHVFVSDAIKKGAALAVVQKDKMKEFQDEWDGFPLWIVPSSLKALHKLAFEWRFLYQIPMLNITGSNGKTTTRALIATLLRIKYNLHTTEKNYNNHLGVPLTLLDLNDEHELSVMELGANHPGEIADLCALTLPTHGLITNIGFAHVGEFGGPDMVARGKLELFECLNPPRIMFVNLDDKKIKNFYTPDAVKITYSLKSTSADFYGKISGFTSRGFGKVRINDSPEFTAPVPGYSGVMNTLSAFVVAESFGIKRDEIIAALSSFKSIRGRMSLRKTAGLNIIDDTYNANPDSARDSIQTLSLMRWKGKKILVLGDMLELGKWTRKGHEIVAEACLENGIDAIFTIGKLAKYSSDYLKSEDAIEAFHFDNASELISSLKDFATPQDIILFKGSRGSRMETLIEKLEN